MSAQDKDLQDVTRLVVQAVGQRLEGADNEVLEVVVREVVAAMSGAAAVPAPSTPSPPAVDGPDCRAASGAARQDPGAPALDPSAPPPGFGNRAVVTTTGPNKRGVLAAIAAKIADTGGNILDVSQTIVSGFFTMIMVVDISELNQPFSSFRDQLVATSEGLGIHAAVMHEKVLRALQRV